MFSVQLYHTVIKIALLMQFAEEVDYRMCSTRDEEDDRVSCPSLALTITIIMLAPHETSKEKGVLILFFFRRPLACDNDFGVVWRADEK